MKWINLRLRPWLFVVAILGLSLPEPGRAVLPNSHTEPVVDVYQGVEVQDPYRWLEDQDSRVVRAWLDAQSRYADYLLAPLPGREEVKRRVADLMHAEAVGMPVQHKGRCFLTRRLADHDRFSIVLREGPQGTERVLVNPETLDRDVSVEILDVSPDGRLLAYAIRTAGEDEVRVRLLAVDSGNTLPDELPKARYSGVSLLLEGGGIYYAREGEDGGRVFFRTLGTRAKREEEVFHAGAGKIVHCSLSDDGRYLTITVSDPAARRTEVYVQNLAAHGPLRTVVDDLDAAFFAGMAGDRLVLHTTWNAPNGRVLTVDPDRPDRPAWKEIVPERKDATIQRVSAVGGRLLVNYLENAQSRVAAFRLDGTPAGGIDFDTLGTVLSVSGTWYSRRAFVLFSSFHVPDTIYSYDVETGLREVWFRLAAAIDSKRYEVEQVWFDSKDGTRVPMFLVHRKGLKRDGSNPTLLAGYGGFGVSMTPFYQPVPAAWLQTSGGIYAVPSLRGGGELGEAWHRSGMLANKQKTFDDFIAAAEWLIRQGYTRPSRLAAIGSSNGALTIGVAITQRPDLFRAAVCSYGLFDMLRYPRFPVGKLWLPEYGSPDDPEQFRALYAYSPYHHVEPGRKYPAVLLISGDREARVSPMHARKMTAALQQLRDEERPTVLRYHSGAGRALLQPLGDSIEDTTDTVSFLLWQLAVESENESRGSLAVEPYLFRSASGSVEAELGRLSLPESRRTATSRNIELAFVRFPSTAKKPGPPIVFLAGGPGGSGIEAAKGPLFALFQSLRAVGDVIALDQRGTGMSKPSLDCHEAWRLPYDQPATAERVLAAAVEHSRACAEALRATGIDLTAYNTQESADDLEDLRRALGVPRLSLWSVSYGTQLALMTIRRHEASLDRVVLAGVQGPDQALRLPQEVQNQMREIGRLVQADSQAGATVPDLPALMKRVMERLDREPVTVQMEDTISKTTVSVTLGGFDLRWMTAERLGSRDGIRGLPALFQEMDGGDFSALAKFAFRNRKGWLGSAVPYLMQCATGSSEERLARIRNEKGQALLGDVPNFPFPGICQGWGVGELGSELRSPVSSRLPVLMISGTLDSRTSLADAEEVRHGLPNSVHLVIEGAGHGNDLLLSSPEIAQTVMSFLQRQEVRPGRISLAPLTFDTRAAQADPPAVRRSH
jgi:prolyl oligopeptidase